MSSPQFFVHALIRNMTFLHHLFDQDRIQSQKVAFTACRESHPKYRFYEFSIPDWFESLEVWRAGNNKLHQELIHELYHVVLDNQIDRMQMLNAIKAGITFAIMQNHMTKGIVAVAAITVGCIEEKAVILFLGIHHKFRNHGFGSQLLMIVGSYLKFQGQSEISLMLLANKASNWRAASFYQNRGFTKLQELSCIAEFDNSNFAQFIKRDDNELTWFAIPNFEKNFILGPSTVAKCPLIEHHNPDWFLNSDIYDKMIYAQFPALLTHSECNDCGKALLILGIDHPELFENQPATEKRIQIGFSKVCQDRN